MSDVQPAAEQGLAVPQGPSMAMPDGLEDMTAADLSTPRITINHDSISWLDGQSNEEWSSLDDAVILGLVKQRVLWPADQGEGKQQPMCKSFDAKTGHAVPATFPFASTAFDPTAYPKENSGDMERIALPCADCTLTNWDTHPRRDSPWCTLQNTLIVLLNFDGIYMPSLISFQRSALKPCNAYLSTFVRSAKPPYTHFTTMRLEEARRGSNTYAVPKFVKGQATDPASYAFYSQSFREVRDFLTQTLRGDDEEMLHHDETQATPVAQPVVAQPSNPAPSPSPTPAPVPTQAVPAASPAPAPAPSQAGPGVPEAPTTEQATVGDSGENEPDDLPF